MSFIVGGQTFGTIEEALKASLLSSGAKQTLEVRESNGYLLGTFIPNPESIVPWDPSISAEELIRRGREPGGMSLKEYWKKMGQA